MKPRILEIEHFLGVEEDVRSAGDEWIPVKIYDEKDPYRAAKTIQMMEMVESTPSFPIVCPQIPLPCLMLDKLTTAFILI